MTSQYIFRSSRGSPTSPASTGAETAWRRYSRDSTFAAFCFPRGTSDPPVSESFCFSDSNCLHSCHVWIFMKTFPVLRILSVNILSAYDYLIIFWRNYRNLKPFSWDLCDVREKKTFLFNFDTQSSILLFFLIFRSGIWDFHVNFVNNRALVVVQISFDRHHIVYNCK